VSRRTALARLAAAYGAHEVRRRFRRAAPGEAGLLATYAEDRLLPLTIEERELLPEAEGCISCGLCALVAARVSGLRPADLAPAYLRDYPRLALAAADWESGEPGDEALAAAAEACPMGVPLPGVLAMVRRLAST
jgi:succinate dehydrogenase/fumarate reductase-like Fe-S protein